MKKKYFRLEFIIVDSDRNKYQKMNFSEVVTQKV